MSVNKVILIGNVGKDPDVRYLDSGVAVATFSLATTDRAYTLANGTQVPERTEWHNIVLWRGLAQTAEKYVRKGDKLYIEGKSEAVHTMIRMVSNVILWKYLLIIWKCCLHVLRLKLREFRLLNLHNNQLSKLFRTTYRFNFV